MTAGAIFPYCTSATVDLTAIGMPKPLTVHPKGQITPYAELSYRFGYWELGVYFEQLKWQKSADVAFSGFIPKAPGSVLAADGIMFQPKTIVNHSGLSVVYHF